MTVIFRTFRNPSVKVETSALSNDFIEKQTSVPALGAIVTSALTGCYSIEVYIADNFAEFTCGGPIVAWLYNTPESIGLRQHCGLAPRAHRDGGSLGCYGSPAVLADQWPFHGR